MKAAICIARNMFIAFFNEHIHRPWNAALAILKALSDQDKLNLANILTSYEGDQDRITGLELLELSLETQTGSIQTLNNVLETEGDPSVLSKAISITSNLPEDTDVQDTLQLSLIHI